METAARMETAAMCPFEAAKSRRGGDADSTFLSKLSLLRTTSGPQGGRAGQGDRVMI